MIAPIDDIDRLMAVMATGFDPAFGEAWNRRQVEDALLVGNCTYGLAATHGGTPAADEPAAGFYLARAGYEESELLLIAVDPAHRGKGIGGALLARFAAEARAAGALRLLLEMRRGNPAEGLYLRFGFAPIGARPHYYRTPGGERLDAVTFACSCE